MFSVEYMYVPLMGKAYISMDYCSALEIVAVGNNMQMSLSHKAKDLQGNEVTVTSNIVIPRQRVSVKVV